MGALEDVIGIHSLGTMNICTILLFAIHLKVVELFSLDQNGGPTNRPILPPATPLAENREGCDP